MAYMNWDDSLSVGVREIDDQHKKLIGMVKEFYEGLQGKDKEALGSLLNSLVDYAVYHFRTEEKYMDRFNYPEADRHKIEHRLFKEKIADIKRRFDDGTMVMSLEITNFVKDWILVHIRSTDKKYSKCFNDHGLK